MVLQGGLGVQDRVLWASPRGMPTPAEQGVLQVQQEEEQVHRGPVLAAAVAVVVAVQPSGR